MVRFPVSSCTLIQVGRSFRDMTRARHSTIGTKAMATRPSRQLVTSISPPAAPMVTKIDRPLTIPMLTNIRTASTSAVALDIRLPVCCLSWNPKLRPWSLRKKSSRMSKAARCETASDRYVWAYPNRPRRPLTIMIPAASSSSLEDS